MGLFKQIAEPLIARNVPVIPLRPRTKIAFLSNWPDVASTDPKKIEEWDQEFPDANGACVAKPGGIWILEIDREGYLQKIEEETGQKIPPTFAVRSSPGRGHLYFRSNAKSVAMGNVKVKGDDGHELFSARVDNAYVVAPLSYHPTSGKRYEILRDADIITAPDWLIDWISKRNVSATDKSVFLVDTKKISSGSRNNTLTSLLGRARQTAELNAEELFALGLRLNQERCEPPLSEQEVRTIASSVGRYAISDNTPKPVIFGGAPAGQVAPVEAQEQERPVLKAVPYPVFPNPKWLFKGCSIYEGFVKPICEANPSRRAEFMMLPALVILLNYIGTKVRIEYKSLIPSMYLVLVARKGRLFKSSSIQDAVEYLRYAGVVDYAHAGTRNAEGKSLIWTAGSPEGLGIEMTRTNCKSSILFYDELATLSKKTSIEGSNLGQSLSTMYESGLFANTVKSKKDQYSHEPRSYCASLIAATTDKNFISTMSPIITSAQGNDERFFYLFQPEILPDSEPYKWIDTKDAAVLTRQRIDKAVQKGVYSIEGDTTRLEHLSSINNRVEQRAEKWALALAIDLGRNTIDDDVLEKAYEISRYELAVKKYLFIPETTTREGNIQAEILHVLQRSGGSVTYRELNKALHPEKYGTSLWRQVYVGLMQGGWITESGTGLKGDPKQVVLMRVPESDED